MARPNTNPDEDGELARQIAAGAGIEAERELCRRLLPRMRIFFARRLADPYTVEDASHDALLALLLAVRAGRLDDFASVGAYALGICGNLVRQQVRRDIRRHRALLREDRDQVSVFPEPRLRVGRLEECLHFLPDRDRTLLRMTFVEGRGSADAGAELGITAQNARVRRHRAIDALRRCLGVGRYEAER